MQNEQQLQPYEEEEGGLSTGAQLGIAAGFLGLIPLEMVAEAISVGEAGFIVAALAAGGLGLGTKMLIDRHHSNNEETDDEQAGPSLGSRLAHATGLDRLQYADWGALFREIGASAPTSQLKEEREVTREMMQSALEVDDTRVQEAYVLNLGITFRPHPNAVFSNRIAVLGMPGAGKSNSVAVFAEELGQYDAPLIIFDQKPEYGHLCAFPYLIHPFKANASNVTPDNAYDFGQRMMKERLQVVLDLTSYKNDDKAAYVMIDIIKGVWAWEEARANKDRIPCTFFLEEADYWLPQSEQHAHVDRSREKGGKSLFNLLQMAFFNLIHRGRSFGMGCIVSTQRPATVDNRAIAVAEWKILLKANMPNDLKVYQGFGLDPDAAQVLGKGEAFVIGPDIRGTFQIRLRRSPDEAQTPGLENLQRKPVVREQIAHQPLPSTSTTTSEASSVSTSIPTSTPSTQEVAGNGATGSRKWAEVDQPLPQLSELEKQIGDLFFIERQKKSKIIELLYPPNAKGGNANIKASEEIDDAIRKYAEVARHRAIRMMREERGV